jgi:DNA-binding response OmpR family regulator
MSNSNLKSTQLHLLKPGTILVIDDDPAFRNEMRDILEDENYEVQCLESANHALRYIQAQAWSWYPWLIITDLVMDGMGGYQLMRRLNEIYANKNIPIVVVSRLGSAEDKIEAEIAGAAAYLKKPVEPKKLIDTIKKVTTKTQKQIEITTSSKQI